MAEEDVLNVFAAKNWAEREALPALKEAQAKEIQAEQAQAAAAHGDVNA